ncbi:MAG: hypothetical protein ABS58_04950 [Mesorhizobium sp. SCN 65-20]|nr:MAG: hypothetical protein ABS58_04950 [Mesorhizobium sp. SCN 65-20]
MRLHAAEKFSAVVTGLLFMIDGAIIMFGSRSVDLKSYAGMIAIGMAVVLGGQIYRRLRPNERIASALTATGLFVLFTLSASLFNYLLLPVGDRRIDTFFIEVDALVGYRWDEFVAFVAQFPVFSSLLRAIYLSSLPQIVMVIVFLGFSRRFADLHLFLLTGILAALATIFIWYVLPSSGPSAYQVIAGDVAARARLVVDSNYGAELNRLMLEGPAFISPRDTLGLIAFPSFHIVMACLSVWFMAGFRRVFPLVLAVNVLMLPAILLHGGHHLVDIAGGLAVFALALWGAKAMLGASRFASMAKSSVVLAHTD